MPDKLAILKEGGETVNTSIISVFTIPELNKKFIITTENAVDPHGLTVLHVSEIDGDKLLKIESDEEWASIKTIMRAIISNSVGNYQYIPSITEANASGQYSRDISVSAAAAKQMSDSYANGEKVEPVVPEVEEISQEVDSIFPTAPVQSTENEVMPGISIEESDNVNIQASPDLSNSNPVSIPTINVNETVGDVNTSAVGDAVSLVPDPAQNVVVETPISEVAPIVDNVVESQDSNTPVVEESILDVAPVASNDSTISNEDSPVISVTPVADAAPQVSTIVENSNPESSVESVVSSADSSTISVTPVVDSVVENPVQESIFVPTESTVDSLNSGIVTSTENSNESVSIPVVGGNGVDIATVSSVPVNDLTIPNVVSSSVSESIPIMNESVAPVGEVVVADEPAIVDPNVDSQSGASVDADIEVADVSSITPPEDNLDSSVLSNDSVNDVSIASVPVDVAQTSVNQSTQVPQTSAMQSMGISLDFGAQPNIDPKASLDEVVAGAQELFQEGVKNLIQVMTERMYRDLKAKEADLKQREIIVSQREQAINNSTMAMMNQQSMMQPQMSQPMMQPQMTQPMMQSQMSQPIMQPQMTQPMMQPQMPQVQNGNQVI